MVDDNLAIAKCGTSSLMKNSVINSFFETQRLQLSEEKSVVLHIGRKKCQNTCPKLKVHDSEMRTAESVRYLGDVISSSGSLRLCLEDRRNRGWGKVAEMTGILAEMPNERRIEVGLKLREAKVHNGILSNGSLVQCHRQGHGQTRTGGHGSSEGHYGWRPFQVSTGLLFPGIWHPYGQTYHYGKKANVPSPCCHKRRL